MVLRGMIVFITGLVLLTAGYTSRAQGLAMPRSTACLAMAGQLGHVNTIECQSQDAPTALAHYEAPTPTHLAPSAARLAKLLTITLYLPVVQVPGLPTAVPSPTAIVPSVAAPTPTARVTAVPGGNQLVNPCFEGQHNDDPPGWQQTAGWDVSWKPSNPCEPSHMAARINDPAQAGESAPDTDERIWQVVPGQGAYLVAEMQCVHHFAYYTDMNIYGGASPNGPWALVWKPFTLADCDQDLWSTTVRHTETQLAQGYAYYKVEFAAMYATESGGVKFTSVLFVSSE